MAEVGGKGIGSRMAAGWRRLRPAPGATAIDVTIHPDDEMYAFICDIEPDTPVDHYLGSGQSMVEALTGALGTAGRTLDRRAPFLEFACGHGRFTRHVVLHVDQRAITVSDIHPGAVEFVTETFGVDGFVSVTDPATLDHTGRYRTIFVASLFSHLGHHRWIPWLEALIEMLEPDGVLVVSTHGDEALGRLEDRTGLTEVEDGFWYGSGNETLGRLDGADYGTAYVDEAFVRRTTERLGGVVLGWAPCALWSIQDLYVIGRR